jgi:hypothetical protein
VSMKEDEGQNGRLRSLITVRSAYQEDWEAGVSSWQEPGKHEGAETMWLKKGTRCSVTCQQKRKYELALLTLDVNGKMRVGGQLYCGREWLAMGRQTVPNALWREKLGWGSRKIGK